MAAPPTRTSPEIGTLTPMNTATTPRTMAMTPRPIQRETTFDGRSTSQPRSTTWPSRARSKSSTAAPNLGRSSGSMKCSEPSRPAQPLEGDGLGRAGRASRVALRAGLLLDVVAAAGAVSMPTLVDSPSRPFSSRKAMRPARGQVEHGRRQGPTRRAAIQHERAGRGGQLRRRCRHEDGRVVQVDRVLAEPAPREERPAGQAQEHDRGQDQAERGVDLAPELEPGGVLRRGRLVDALQRDEQRLVEVARRQVRDHVARRRSRWRAALSRKVASKPGAA